MRILEKCTPLWPLAEMQPQINALREAFSADTSQPFELKLSFPWGSPEISNRPSPYADSSFVTQASNMQQHPDNGMPAFSYQHRAISPPMSTGGGQASGRGESPPSQAIAGVLGDIRNASASPHHGSELVEPPQWNPSGIFEYVVIFLAFSDINIWSMFFALLTVFIA